MKQEEQIMNIELERRIKTIELKDGFVAFKDFFIDKETKKVLKQKEGIVRKKTIQEIQRLNLICNLEFLEDERNSILNPYIVPKTFCEQIRTCLYWKWYDDVKVKEMMNAYTWIENHPTEDYEIIYHCNTNENFYNSKLEVLPKATRLDYINAKIDDLHYNLSALQDFIKNRCQYKIASCELQEIPYYNRESRNRNSSNKRPLFKGK